MGAVGALATVAGSRMPMRLAIHPWGIGSHMPMRLARRERRVGLLPQHSKSTTERARERERERKRRRCWWPGNSAARPQIERERVKEGKEEREGERVG